MHTKTVSEESPSFQSAQESLKKSQIGLFFIQGILKGMSEDFQNRQALLDQEKKLKEKVFKCKAAQAMLRSHP